MKKIESGNVIPMADCARKARKESAEIDNAMVVLHGCGIPYFKILAKESSGLGAEPIDSVEDNPYLKMNRFLFFCKT